ncbi:spondin domain-containing protein [Paraglaciecola sp. 2405UD69-4]|uniref:spondin domain-containing protein n=1 Tax=Paraglaciecola sp. 2405UD69-4 TaxID=3391836 RepID=UPI0039C9E843
MKNNILKFSTLALLMALAAGCADDGKTGPAGPAGADGINGVDGVDGVDGQDGADGVDGQDGSSGTSAVYTVQITNATFGQPLGAAAIILHEPGYHAFVDGEAASLGLEITAESGNPDTLLEEAVAATNYHIDSVSSGAPVFPKEIGEEQTLIVPTSDVDNLYLTVASMLGNTNDAFTGLNAVDVSNMTVGQSSSFMAPTWDAGTEANTETIDTIPGPASQALGGGGDAAAFNAERDDLFNLVHFHPGVVTNANATDASLEGLSDSVLGEEHRFSSISAKITITRTR